MRLFIFFLICINFQYVEAQSIYCTTPGNPYDPGWEDWLKNDDENGPFFVMVEFRAKTQTNFSVELAESYFNNLKIEEQARCFSSTLFDQASRIRSIEMYNRIEMIE